MPPAPQLRDTNTSFFVILVGICLLAGKDARISRPGSSNVPSFHDLDVNSDTGLATWRRDCNLPSIRKYLLINYPMVLKQLIISREVPS